MRVLVTGGSGIIGRPTVSALLRRGHSVRLLARDAEHDASAWDGEVEAVNASVVEPARLAGACDGCDVVIHIAGIAAETADQTFDAVNVEGTRNIVAEAARAGSRRLVFVSSLGAERGESAYHRSKREAEKIARAFPREWVIIRPGNVYGPGDDVISRLLTWVRSLPVVPVIGVGEDPFQPIWVEDAAAALVAAAERDGVAGRVLEMTGPDQTNLTDLLDRLAALTGRSPLRVPVPAALMRAGISAASAAGVELPVSDAQLHMLLEHNVIGPDSSNALSSVLGIRPTPLDEGLRKLADAQPAQLPDEGVGPMTRKLYWAVIRGSSLDARALTARLRARFGELMPGTVESAAEAGTPSRLHDGATLTLGLPVRGHIQVRVADVQDREVTLVTLRGHPLAGAVRFRAEDLEDGVRFEIAVFDRAANVADWFLMAVGGSVMQRRTWEELVRAVAAEAGGAIDDVHTEQATLGERERRAVDAWLEALAEPAPGVDPVKARPATP